MALCRVSKLQLCFHHLLCPSRIFHPMCIPIIRKLHPASAGWCSCLKGCWEVNCVCMVSGQTECGNRCCLLLSFTKFPSDLSWWMPPFLGSTEIASGLCWGYKKDSLGQAVFFFTVFMMRERPWRGKGEKGRGWGTLMVLFVYRILLILTLPLKGLRKGPFPKGGSNGLRISLGERFQHHSKWNWKLWSLWIPCSAASPISA